MQIVLDFETYYDNQFSLRRMTPVEYIKDHRFEVIGCAVKVGDKPAVWMTDEALRAFIASLPPKVTVVSHNALFDMCILAWVYNYVPHIMIDTLGMARAWVGHKLKSLSLSSVAMHYGVGIKGGTVHKVEGMRLAAIKAAGFYDEYAAYSINDADLCWAIYRKMVSEGYPVNEIAVMDTVLRCAVQPRFKLDHALLAEHLAVTKASKDQLLASTGMTSRDDLMSNVKFAAVLESLGVEPPMKISLTTGKETYAFSKTDPDFIALEDHEDPRVQTLVAARMGIKSTLEETRTERLISIANLTWDGNEQGIMPMPLRYSGAHTHRLSGEWKINMQNLPRGGVLRKCLVAPSHHKVVACDASQIEARIAAWFAGQENMVQAFANGDDIYSLFASEVFGYAVNKKTHPTERFVGKTAILGLQYGLGWQKFQKTVKLQSKSQLGTPIELSDEQAQKTVETYRKTYPNIPVTWQKLNNQITWMTKSDWRQTIGPVTFEHQRIRLPSGLFLNYHDLHNDGATGRWKFTYGGKPKDIYGGKMLENIVQALARICVMNAAVNIRRRLALITDDVRLNLQVHDELVYIVPDELEQVVTAIVHEEMIRRPDWAPNLPLAAEYDSGLNYGDAK